MPTPTPPLAFGRFELRPAERQLLRDSQALPVGARAFDVLMALVERRERIVNKHELLEAAWPGMVVEENNIAVQVGSLRRLLGPSAIATIPGRGYRFTALADGGASPPAAPSSAAPVSSEAASPSAPPSNLPAATRLYGREADLQALTELLRDHAIVSVVGAGGIGKTKLALCAALAVPAPDFPHGRWWVELAAVNEPSLVAETIATALGASLPAGRSPSVALGDLLAQRRLLLVLDNCEHLADGLVPLIDLLRAQAPGVRLLLTSQESLKCEDERVYRLGSLEIPAQEGTAQARDCGAVALFVERARAADPRFDWSEHNAQDVVAICRRLDGIPLAIELAAARVPLLGVQGLHTRLDRMFDVLTGSSRMKLRRHQTLRAALEWSVGLLSADERAVLRRLGVFVGGFTLELAQQVARDHDMDEWRVLDILGVLIDRSLVIAEASRQGYQQSDMQLRYRLLEPTRAFALEQLAAAGESAAWLRRHAETLRDWLTPFEAARWTLPPPRRKALALELGNLRAAADWTESAGGDTTLTYDLLAKGWLVWQVSGAINEGLQRMCRLWPPPAALAPEIQAGFGFAMSRCAGESAPDDVLAGLRASVALYREAGDNERLGEALIALAFQGVLRNDQPDTQATLDDGIRLVDSNAPPRKRAWLAAAEGSWAWRREDYAQALRAIERQADVFRAADLEEGVQLAINNRCGILIDSGDYVQAVALAQDSALRLRRLQSGGLAWALIYVALARTMLGDDAGLLPVAHEAFTAGLAIGTTYQPLNVAAVHHARRGDFQRAALVAGHARKMREGQKFHPVAIDLRMEALLRRTIEAAHSPGVFEVWLAEGEALSQASAVAIAFDMAPLAGSTVSSVL
jgi:predicted ATPase/DNA-binding winged helix-turn-helix (wHTH) protein